MRGLFVILFLGGASALCVPTPGARTVDPASLTIRVANLANRADAEAICAVRQPTQYVIEDGTVGFMGKRVELSPEEAFKRRVEARLGTAIRDRAIVLIAVEDTVGEDGPALAVRGTADLIGPLSAGKGRRSIGPDLPERYLLRNLWVAEPFRRRGLARRLMAACEERTLDAGLGMLALEVDAKNGPARALYEDLGYTELDPPPVALPEWMRGTLMLGKPLE